MSLIKFRDLEVVTLKRFAKLIPVHLLPSTSPHVAIPFFESPAVVVDGGEPSDKTTCSTMYVPIKSRLELMGCDLSNKSLDHLYRFIDETLEKSTYNELLNTRFQRLDRYGVSLSAFPELVHSSYNEILQASGRPPTHLVRLAPRHWVLLNTHDFRFYRTVPTIEYDKDFRTGATQGALLYKAAAAYLNHEPTKSFKLLKGSDLK